MPDTSVPPSPASSIWTGQAAGAALGGLLLLDKNRLLVSAGAPGCRHRHVEQTEVHAELASMLKPVTEHDVSQELRAGNGQHLLIALDHPPGFSHRGIAELWQHGSDRDNTLVERPEDFSHACGLGHIIEIGRLGRVLLHEPDTAARHAGD